MSPAARDGHRDTLNSRQGSALRVCLLLVDQEAHVLNAMQAHFSCPTAMNYIANAANQWNRTFPATVSPS